MKKGIILKIGTVVLVASLLCYSVSNMGNDSSEKASATQTSSVPEPPEGGPGGDAPGGGPGGDNSSGVTEYTAVQSITSDTTIDGEELSSTGTDENVLHVSGGANVTVKNSSITRTSSDSTGGDNSSFYGVGAALLCTEGILNISDSTVTTDAAGGAGVFAYGDGVVNVADTTITTAQDTSGGIHAAGGGTLRAWDVTATTSGQSSAAIRSDRGGGTMIVDGGTYTSNGVGSPAIYSTADITVHDAKLTANGSEAICIEGLNSIRLFDCSLTGNMSDDSQNDCTWNVILYQSMSGDSEVGNSTFEMQGGTLTGKNGGMFYTTNTESTITLKDVDINNSSDSEFFLQCTGNNNQRGWGSEGSNGADCLFTAISQDMSGKVIWDSISQLDFYMTDASTLKGAVVQDDTNAGDGGSGYCNMYISSDSVWTVTGDSTVTNLYNAGTIKDSSNKTVTIKGTSGKVYVDGDSSYTITVSKYSTSVDASGASKTSSWSDYEVDKTTAMSGDDSAATATPSSTESSSSDDTDSSDDEDSSDNDADSSDDEDSSDEDTDSSDDENSSDSNTDSSSVKVKKSSVISAKRSAGGKKLTVVAKKTSAVTGYQVRCSTSKNYKKKKTSTKSVKSNKVTFTKLSKNKTYYVSVRTYKVVNGKKYYSSWSKSKKA